MTVTLSPTQAQCLAVAAQRLSGPRLPATLEGIVEIFRILNCVQIDPIRAVERTQLLVLWSRLGPFDPTLLDRLQEDRLIFESWAHCASFVRTEDFPLFAHWKRRESTSGGAWGQRVRDWVAANDDLRQHILDRLAEEGPLTTGDFEDLAAVAWESTGWSSGRSVTRMLDFLHDRGQVMAIGRNGNAKFWHLTEKWLPDWVDHEPWTEEDVVRLSAGRSLRALGIATPKQIKNHFIRNQYPDLPQRLAELAAVGTILPAQIVDRETVWPGEWFIHGESLPVLDAIRRGDWQPRTVFLSPFDNLICDRQRTESLFNFNYRIEIYVPKEKRQYGYYVLPILHGERFIGRMDSQLNRKTGIYQIYAIYPESEDYVTTEAGAAIAHSLRELMIFIGAKSLALGEQIPAPWRAAILDEIGD
ncbi:MAG: YcaQ family DNA glycosylase [Caldilineaceae bacterium]|nr:YcaQ family DNA glycosylase [Caldilineaceae bacterium]